MRALNPGIRRLVGLLNEAGFETCDSGDGETHDYECDRPHGYVVVVIDLEAHHIDERTDALADLLEANGLQVVPMSMEDPPEGQCWVQATYVPRQGAYIEVMHVHDRMLTSSAPTPSEQEET